MEPPSFGVVPMRFYANWDTDRASNYSIPRALSMVLSRLTFYKCIEIENTIVICVRLQGHKRSLRSNDISVPSIQQGVRVDLDISFIIQYSHFVKRKANVLEIFIQRRKKYKNRQIPGFKTLAAGFLNLDDLLQMGGSREVKIFSMNQLSKPDVDVNDSHVATIFISHCQTVAIESGQKNLKHSLAKDLTARDDSEDDVLEDESSGESEEEVNDLVDFDSSNRMRRKRRIPTKKSQKNLKQRLTKLLRRFKVPEENVDEGDTHSVLKPTAEELEEIFEELENISDSGPEIEMDKLSIRSNPRPGLHRPFFGSKSDILPVIDDAIASEESESEEQEQFSSDNENNQTMEGAHNLSKFDQRILKHSNTNGSINYTPNDVKPNADSTFTINDMLTRLDSDSSIVASNVWICSSTDFSWISRVDFSSLKRTRVLDCPSASDVRTVVHNIISRIQKFCNTNSVAPSPTLIGVYGTDRHVSHILRAYVDFLQNKPTQAWITHLRFTILCPPASALGRLLSQASDTGHAEASWRSLSKIASQFEAGDITPGKVNEMEEILFNAMNAAVNPSENRLLNLPIGEVMLQLSQSNWDSSNNGNQPENKSDTQLFVPFLSEIHLGNLDELNYLYFMKNSFDDAPSQSNNNSNQSSSSQQSNQNNPVQLSNNPSSISPPVSPQLPKQQESSKELHLEYWTDLPSTSLPTHHDLDPLDQSFMQNTPGSAKSSVMGNKYSIKATLRTLSIARESMSSLLSIQFVKEKRKDKVLQKLGRKPKPKNAEGFAHSQARVVANVSRLLCSGGKNSELELSIDGVFWKHIRFFQVASQWQTHVKQFPISMPSPPQTAR
ncbi:unnamed protein product [Bursaphelenchus xylophilus]|uniref:(pine wood nematode) hypothetical protein n=1 Tax=Bursaphelenchus xylophilus TaxID=6326 RepID=A0A1I7RRT2_BURXY|nr:unnamed protein product [Bursaphelenchus xylophilus]CAG9123493.1 unnamed protein product [Bursaphelenchus xylophilus]